VKTHVGFVGVGALGEALLERLRLAGVAAKAYDIADASLAAARELGAEIVGSPSAAGRDADFVHVCVRTDEEVLAVTLGAQGVLAGMTPPAVLIVHSTIVPETTRRVADEAATVGVAVVDATVIGIPAWVRTGDASFLLGGADVVIERVTPHLRALGKTVYHFGPLGAGNVAKIAKNLATAIDRVAMTEVVALAEAGGLDARAFLDMMRVEHRSLTDNWERAFAIDGRHAVGRPATNLLNKDVHHAADFARAHDLDLPVTRGAAEGARAMVAAWDRAATSGVRRPPH